jgi:ribosomal protein S18 acetylase RimI-like enzyme
MITSEGTSAGADPHHVTGSLMPLQWHVLAESEWHILREARLTALKESPRCFLSNYEKELGYEQKRWREEFSRGEWTIATKEGDLIDGLMGATCSDDISSNERYLEYLWILPGSRRSGLATRLIHNVLGRLSASGIITAWLWILDGNEPARRLYEKFGFVSTNERQQLKADPLRYEERMKLKLN